MESNVSLNVEKIDEYWACVKKQKAATFGLFKKISKGVLKYYELDTQVFQSWQHTYAQKDSAQDQIDEVSANARADVQITKSTKSLTKEDALKCIAREKQIMVNATVDLVIAMYGKCKTTAFEA